MKRHLKILSVALLLPVASAQTELHIYQGFAEVNETAAVNAAGELVKDWTRQGWDLTLPSSVGVKGATVQRLRVTVQDWTAQQEGQSVRVVRGGQLLSGKLVRARDLLVQLDSGEYLYAKADELAWASAPSPLAVRATVQVTNVGAAPSLSYRTRALAWKPVYELNLSGQGANLRALAEIRNIGDTPFSAQKVNVYGGNVAVYNPYGPIPASMSAESAGRAVATSSDLQNMVQVGEMRGFRRYLLSGGLEIDAGETQTVPFLQPKVDQLKRFFSISQYFNTQGGSGSAIRRYKFSHTEALPGGAVTVRDDGLIVGLLTLAPSQAGKTVDLTVGPDHELTYTRSVKRGATEKLPNGRVNQTYTVTYNLTNTKAAQSTVLLSENIYGRQVVLDGKTYANTQATHQKWLTVPGGGKLSYSFSFKQMN